MAAAVFKTLAMQVTTGYVVALGQPCAYVQCTTKADCWVKPVYSPNSTPAPPAGTPAPGAGLTADWIHLASSGDKLPADWRDGSAQSQQTDQYTHVLVWAVAAGDLLIYAR